MTTRPVAMPRAAALTLLMIAGVWSSAVPAAPRLRCTLEQADTALVRDFPPGSDPYGVEAVDLAGRFRFKAVVMGDGGRVDYVKLYASYRANGRWYLLQEAKYLSPPIQAGGPADSLTGRNSLYAWPYGREFRYWCALLEVVP